MNLENKFTLGLTVSHLVQIRIYNTFIIIFALYGAGE